MNLTCFPEAAINLVNTVAFPARQTLGVAWLGSPGQPQCSNRLTADFEIRLLDFIENQGSRLVATVVVKTRKKSTIVCAKETNLIINLTTESAKKTHRNVAIVIVLIIIMIIIIIIIFHIYIGHFL